MEPTIAAAIIGALATLGAGILGILRTRAGKSKASPTEPTRTVEAPQAGTPENMKGRASRRPEVLVVEDNLGDIHPLLAWIYLQGYEVVLATNEIAARKLLLEFAAGRRDFVLGLFDIMFPARDVFEMADFGESDLFFDASISAGVRLCEFVRHDCLIPASRLPVVAYSVRDDDDLRASLKALGVRFMPKSSFNFREELLAYLPKLEGSNETPVAPNQES